MEYGHLNQVNILELLYSYVKHSKIPLRVSIVSESYKNLIGDWENILSKNNCATYANDYTISDYASFCFNKSLVEFFSPDNKTKLYAPKRDILFSINLGWEQHKELMIRTIGAVITL